MLSGKLNKMGSHKTKCLFNCEKNALIKFATATNFGHTLVILPNSSHVMRTIMAARVPAIAIGLEKEGKPRGAQADPSWRILNSPSLKGRIGAG